MDKWDNHFVIKSPVPPCFVPHFLFPVHALPETWLFRDGQQAWILLNFLSCLSSCRHPYVFPLISMQKVFFLLFSQVIFLSVLDLALLFLVLLCWSSCYYPGSPLPPPFLLGELLLICVAHKSPGLGEVPLLCTLTASPALLRQAVFS